VLFLRDGYLVEEVARPTAIEVADLLTELTRLDALSGAQGRS
jgi:hypothetical protein